MHRVCSSCASEVSMRLTTHARKQLVFSCFAALRGVRAQAKFIRASALLARPKPFYLIYSECTRIENAPSEAQARWRRSLRNFVRHVPVSCLPCGDFEQANPAPERGDDESVDRPGGHPAS